MGPNIKIKVPKQKRWYPTSGTTIEDSNKKKYKRRPKHRKEVDHERDL